MTVVPAGLEVTEVVADQSRERVFQLRSDYQSDATTLRILYPDSAGAIDRIIHVLPVEVQNTSLYGNGYQTLKHLNAHNHYQVVVVSASFTQSPWYGNHPANSKIQQERYYVEHIVGFLNNLYRDTKLKHSLLGFSKSGVGAMSLMLRHPSLFYVASVWDTTLIQETPDKWEMRDIFGTDENYAAYQVKTLLKQNAAMLRQRKRIALSGYGIFREYVETSHQLLIDLDIPHDYICNTKHEHHWQGGWVLQSLEMLDRLSHL